MANSNMRRRKKEAAAAGASAPLPLQLQRAESDTTISRIAAALRDECPSLGEGGGEEATPTVLAASLCAYADGRALQSVEQWVQLLLEVLADASASLDDDDGAGSARRVVQRLVRSGVLRPMAPPLAAGDLVMAELAEDDQWHHAMVCEQVSDGAFDVVFLQFDKHQLMPEAKLRRVQDIVDDFDDEAAGAFKEGECEMCRQRKFLTFHHLVPKDTHPTYLNKRLPPGVEGMNPPDRSFLNQWGIMVCRGCHSFIHGLAPNTVLAIEFNTLQKILADPRVKRRVDWLAKE